MPSNQKCPFCDHSPDFAALAEDTGTEAIKLEAGISRGACPTCGEIFIYDALENGREGMRRLTEDEWLMLARDKQSMGLLILAQGLMRMRAAQESGTASPIDPLGEPSPKASEDPLEGCL